ncbi:MAG: tRNA 2-thiocytidine biosynthesis TtcA family protein [Lachnospiraceae bacterium]|nr:tRNA 2-thiocytidine biosynthesis TtcA family protein [Lachnospiraceae bacterium]
MRSEVGKAAEEGFGVLDASGGSEVKWVSSGSDASEVERVSDASDMEKLSGTLMAEPDVENTRREAERSIIKQYRSDLWSRFTRAVNQYGLICQGDRIAVCVSGGKDSFLMAKLFQELYRHGERNFEPVYLTMDPGYNDLNRRKVEENANLLGIELIRFRSPIFEIVDSGEQSPCYPCARMRRGALYSHAKELGCNKIALGHHYDDVIETILMGMLYGGQIQTMMPKLHSVNFQGMELIRPMYLIREESIIKWAKHNGLEFIKCACSLTNGLKDDGDGGKRAEIKALIRKLHEVNPYTEANIFKSVENVNLATIIAYKKDGEYHHFLDDYAHKKQ